MVAAPNTQIQPQLFLNVGNTLAMKSKAIYFMRTNPKGVNATSPEQDICYGEVPADPLRDFNMILAKVTIHFFTPTSLKCPPSE